MKVTNDYGTVWFVANFDGDFSDAYLSIPSDIADKSLRREAVAPDVEVTERSTPVAVPCVTSITDGTCMLQGWSS